jgi:hypothetical protein
MRDYDVPSHGAVGDDETDENTCERGMNGGVSEGVSSTHRGL